MNSRATSQSTEPLAESIPVPGKHSTTWPTAAELEMGPDTLETNPYGSIFGYTESFRGDLAEFFESNETDTLRVFAEPDRHDTIPSPPPELESAPWHDER
jgi:hypothetical protein